MKSHKTVLRHCTILTFVWQFGGTESRWARLRGGLYIYGFDTMPQVVVSGRRVLNRFDIVFRLSAGAVVIEGGRILLVQHGRAVHRQEFLVAPGGGVEGGESIKDAVIRETKEETGLDVTPAKILFIEDMISSRKRVIKFWLLCSVVGGQLGRGLEAAQEGIVESGWYRREDLMGQLVYPSILVDTDWVQFFEDSWQTRYLENRDSNADF
jgi:8-oxo-dGTP diphosphatase